MKDIAITLPKTEGEPFFPASNPVPLREDKVEESTIPPKSYIIQKVVEE